MRYDFFRPWSHACFHKLFALTFWVFWPCHLKLNKKLTRPTGSALSFWGTVMERVGRKVFSIPSSQIMGRQGQHRSVLAELRISVSPSTGFLRWLTRCLTQAYGIICGAESPSAFKRLCASPVCPPSPHPSLLVIRRDIINCFFSNFFSLNNVMNIDAAKSSGSGWGG